MNDMKRLALTIMMMAMACVAVAQRPVITAGSPGYMYTPHPTAYVYDSTQIYPNWMYSQRVRVNFYGNAFRSPNGVTVYGVAVCARDIEKFPYLWVYMMQDRLVDSLSQTTHCYTIDTVASALFSFVEHEPVMRTFSFLGVCRTMWATHLPTRSMSFISRIRSRWQGTAGSTLG